MKQSTLHLAIIMDGNGRWATRRGLPRTDGHRAGARTVRRVVEAAPELGITDLTLYAFSSDNWRRPAPEIRALMGMLERFLARETRTCLRHGVRLSVIGRRDRLSPRVRAAIESAERATRGGETLHLRLAIDYSSRDAILRAVNALRAAEVTRESLSLALDVPQVDLLIRTGGEQRLSDFLLWECAYAEFYFTPRMWPDFGRGDLEDALRHFAQRERRFGAAPAPVPQRLAS
ncbi:MAG: di-trans,poly-cis-decaprenylcistransferase [Bryobacterales bacterium]|nr:di-trans,poly-cis-decaprenylcistransferase [Bryobacterales bacterium]